MDCKSAFPASNAGADFILRSCDGVDFPVHRSILAVASPVFKDMLTLGDAAPDEMNNGLPVCTTITEDNVALRTLLRFCYPREHPTALSLDEVIPALAAAFKYQMEGTQAMAALKTQLTAHAPTDTLRVFVVAVRYGLEDEARIAARAALHHDVYHVMSQNVGELAHFPATALQRLVQFMQQCRDRCARRCEPATPYGECTFLWMVKDDYPMGEFGEFVSGGRWFPHELQSCTCKNAMEICFAYNPLWIWRAPRWWWEFVQAMKGRLRLRPLGETVRNPELLRETHKNDPAAPSCDACRVGIDSFQLMQKFIDFMASEVDRWTYEVCNRIIRMNGANQCFSSPPKRHSV